MKFVPNPAYETAKFEERPISKDGRLLKMPCPNLRGNTIENGKIVDPILPHILVNDDGSPLAKPTEKTK